MEDIKESKQLDKNKINNDMRSKGLSDKDKRLLRKYIFRRTVTSTHVTPVTQKLQLLSRKTSKEEDHLGQETTRFNDKKTVTTWNEKRKTY